MFEMIGPLSEWVSIAITILGILIVNLLIWERAKVKFEYRLDEDSVKIKELEERLSTFKELSGAYLTMSHHDELSESCRSGIYADIDELKADLSEVKTTLRDGERLRIQAREEDNKRWNKIEIALTKVSTILEERLQ